MYDWEALIEAQTWAEFQADHPIRQRFTYVFFVSSSKGHGRRRTRSKEVELIADHGEPYNPPRFRTWDRFPFDEKATDVYEQQKIDGLEGEAKLRREIPQLAKRR